MTETSLSSRLRVVLVRSRNPLNIGAAARAMSNFGFGQLRLVSPYEIAFREARSAVGATAILADAQEYKNLAGAIADCELVVGTTAGKNRELHHPLVQLNEAADVIRRQSGRIALLFGSEKRGLSNEDLSYCHWLLRIPTVEPQPSMNVGQAVVVCLYELIRERAPALPRQEPPAATVRELDLITELFAEALYKGGYMNVEALPSAEQKLRRMIRRLNISADDAPLLLGMLRQLARKS